MPMPDICACITSIDDLPAALAVRDKVALFEVRIDLIGKDWTAVASSLSHPWIACNRLQSEGGAASASDPSRLDSLRRAAAMGAHMVDIELATPKIRAFVNEVEELTAIVVSHHDTVGTPPCEDLAAIVARQRAAGASICKVVTTARSAADNATVLQLSRRFADSGIVSLTMGPLGMTSRVLAPFAGSRFTYASLASGHESAPGQLTVDQLCAIYESMGRM